MKDISIKKFPLCIDIFFTKKIYSAIKQRNFSLKQKVLKIYRSLLETIITTRYFFQCKNIFTNFLIIAHK